MCVRGGVWCGVRRANVARAGSRPTPHLVILAPLVFISCFTCHPRLLACHRWTSARPRAPAPPARAAARGARTALPWSRGSKLLIPRVPFRNATEDDQVPFRNAGLPNAEPPIKLRGHGVDPSITARNFSKTRLGHQEKSGFFWQCSSEKSKLDFYTRLMQSTMGHQEKSGFLGNAHQKRAGWISIHV